jgi:ubiquinone/menaquinone biosynthesis C-methylase UbiE
MNHKIYDPHKKGLFPNISGLIVEIGAGTGVNFPYIPRGTSWIGIEPNAALHETLQKKAGERGTNAKLISAKSSFIPLCDNSVNVFISTLVQYSVDKPSEMLSEIRRILKPGGKLIPAFSNADADLLQIDWNTHLTRTFNEQHRYVNPMAYVVHSCSKYNIIKGLMSVCSH